MDRVETVWRRLNSSSNFWSTLPDIRSAFFEWMSGKNRNRLNSLNRTILTHFSLGTYQVPLVSPLVFWLASRHLAKIQTMAVLKSNLVPRAFQFWIGPPTQFKREKPWERGWLKSADMKLLPMCTKMLRLGINIMQTQRLQIQSLNCQCKRQLGWLLQTIQLLVVAGFKGATSWSVCCFWSVLK